MIRGNAVITAAGFLFASKGTINLWLLLETIIGISFVIACGCVVNNYLDRDIDKKMDRTKNRAFAKGEVSARGAFIFAAILGLIGFGILLKSTNFITVGAALLGALVYIGLYTPLKHTSVHAALVGSISGAVPIVVGYTSVTHHIDVASMLLFIILVLWQMPHFYAISIYRKDDYASASVPVISIEKGIPTTKLRIIMYINAFITAVLLLTLFGFAGYTFAAIMLVLGFLWLYFAIKGFNALDNTTWAKNMFRYSLVVIMVLAVTLSLNSFLI